MKPSSSLFLAVLAMAALVVLVFLAGTQDAIRSSRAAARTDAAMDPNPAGVLERAVAAPTNPPLMRPVRQVFYISETPCGGSLKYVQDLVAYGGAHGVQFHRLPNKAAAEAAADQFQQGDILLFQYVLNTDFTFTDVRDLVLRHRLRLVIPIHEKYFLNDNPDADYAYHASLHEAEAPTIPPDKWALLQLAAHIIFPSQFIHDVFRGHMDLLSMVVVPHIDQQLYRHLIVPPLNETFRIGVITSPTYYKGLDLMEGLFERVTEHRGKKVQYFLYSHYDGSRFPSVVVRGGYAESEVYTRLDQDGIHGLLFLNRYPETYSYALTKGINSGRPLLYTRMGAVAERLVKENDASKYIATDNVDVVDKLKTLLNFIDTHAGQGNADAVLWSRLSDPSLAMVDPFYQDLFLGRH